MPPSQEKNDQSSGQGVARVVGAISASAADTASAGRHGLARMAVMAEQMVRVAVLRSACHPSMYALPSPPALRILNVSCQK
jgi:hypothetical protein